MDKPTFVWGIFVLIVLLNVIIHSGANVARPFVRDRGVRVILGIGQIVAVVLLVSWVVTELPG
jgi:hypothetical protein